MTGKILIACVGNIFLGDDAFGVEVAQRLARVSLPENVFVKDFGIRSYDLAYALMEDWELVILVDAVACDGAPGTIYTIDPELPTGSYASAPDAHSMNPFSVLQLVSALGGKVSRMLVVGCEPASVEADQSGNMGLSTAVAAAVNEAIKLIEELVTRNSKCTSSVVNKGEHNVYGQTRDVGDARRNPFHDVLLPWRC